MKKLIIILALSLSLQGCIFIAGAAAGAAGVAIVYDHRTIEKITKDRHIAARAAEKINATPDLKEHSHIEVTCFNQAILLTGEATTAAYRQQAQDLVNTIPGVQRIYNQIDIKRPSSSFSRAGDSWITAKIKTQMLATKGLKSGSIKVITESGTVYLMGVVTHEQADIAAHIARQVSGVQRVVKIFRYTD